MSAVTFLDIFRRSVVPTIYFFGLTLLLMFTFNLLFVTTGFLFGLTVSWASLVVPFLLAVGACALFAAQRGRERLAQALVAGALCALAIVVACLANSVIFSLDYDGNTYHKMAIGLLKEGWNPIWESSQAAAERYFSEDQMPVMYGTSGGGPDSKAATIDSFGKATWFFSASAYALFGNVEAGKAYNILGILAVFSIAFPYLREKLDERVVPALIVAALLAMGPVPITQIFQYYVDGFLASMMFCLVVGLTQMIDRQSRYHGGWAWVTIICSMIVLGNVKFTGLAFGGALCIVFFVASAVLDFRRQGKQAWRPVLGRFGVFLALAVCAACWAGAPTYVANAIEHGNPVYPLEWRPAVSATAPEASASDAVDAAARSAASGAADEAAGSMASAASAAVSSGATSVADAVSSAAAAASASSAAVASATGAAADAAASAAASTTATASSAAASVATTAPAAPAPVSGLNIMGGNTPTGFFGKPTWYTNFYSLFSEMSNMNYADTPWLYLPDLKPPFTITEGDWAMVTYPTYDTRIGGFGALFGSVLIVALVLFVVSAVLLWKRQRGLVIYATLLAAFIVVLMLGVSESWWARYSPHFYLIPMLALFLTFKCKGSVAWREASRRMRARDVWSWAAGGALAALLAFSNGLFFLGIGTQLEGSARTHADLQELSGDEIKLYNFSLGDDFLLFGGIGFDLDDYDITWTVVPADETDTRHITFFGRLAYATDFLELD